LPRLCQWRIKRFWWRRKIETKKERNKISL
jgi:hypothetical protein